MDKNLIKILKAGGVAVMPTDTIYGLVGQALNRKAVKKINQLKARPTNKHYIVLISSVNDLKKFGVKLSPQTKKTLNLVWPGPVSVAFSNKMAFRLPRPAKLRALLKLTSPLIATSANLAGEKPAQTITEAKKYFGPKVDYYLAGKVKMGQPSALIYLHQGLIKVLRPGQLPKNLDRL